VEAFFLAAGDESGQRFCLFHAPPPGARVLGAVVYIHPFAEELNRSRRMAALQARAFAAAGFAVIQMDLYGCGDSSGDFADASWAHWVGDVAMARDWLLHKTGHVPWLWGLRSGCLLAAEVVRRGGDHPANLLFWQPVVSGRQHLNQFLRLKLAADLVQGTRGNSSAPLAGQLAGGHAVEVAGYGLSHPLASGLELANLDGIPMGSHVACIELAATIGADIKPANTPANTPALAKQVVRWQEVGCVCVAQCLEGAPFWQAVEVELSPALIEASLAVVTRGVV
jgi:exosortase A-associated hydrolase 2